MKFIHAREGHGVTLEAATGEIYHEFGESFLVCLNDAPMVLYDVGQETFFWSLFGFLKPWKYRGAVDPQKELWTFRFPLDDFPWVLERVVGS